MTDIHYQDLHIKTEADVLIISAKKENKTSAGKTYVSKQFEQRFTLPSGVNPEKISSKLGADGVLRISAPRENVSYKVETTSLTKIIAKSLCLSYN